LSGSKERNRNRERNRHRENEKEKENEGISDRFEKFRRYIGSVNRILVIALLFVCSVSTAQIDAVTQEIDGKAYYIHTVEKGHTLYSLSKLYKVEIDEILNNNPESADGLQIGQVLRIPAKSVESKEKWDNPIRIDGAFLIHKVKKGETLFGIAKEYKVDINDILENNPEANNGIGRKQELRIPVNDVDEVTLDDLEPEPKGKQHLVVAGETLYSISKLYEIDVKELKDLNGGLPEGLKAGEWIRIPEDESASIDANETREWKIDIPDSAFNVSDYNITMMLPFYFHELDSAKTSGKHEKLREVALNFYRGASVALDTLKSMGLNASVFVLDAHNDKGNIEALLETPEVKNSHLIVGPLQKSALLKVSKYATRKGIHIVCPVPQSNKVLLNNANLSKVISSDITHVQKMAEVVADQHYLDNVLIIKSIDTKDTRLVQSFQSTYTSLISENVSASHGAAREIPLKGKSIGGLKDYLSLVQRNVIVAPTTDKVIIQDLLTKAGLTDDEKYEIVIYGLEDWLDFQFIDVNYRNRFRLSIPTSTFVNFDDSTTMEFEAKFQENYNTASDLYARIGYDVMLYYGQGLIDHGLNFPNKFNEMSQNGLINLGFDFVKTGMESGFENKHVYMIEHDDFHLQEIAPTFGMKAEAD
jgi:LysM repeat protein